MHARRQKADALERVCKAGTLPGRGASPTRARFAFDTESLRSAPLNGRAFAYVRLHYSKPARARDLRACARRFESVRRYKTFANASNILFKVLL